VRNGHLVRMGLQNLAGEIKLVGAAQVRAAMLRAKAQMQIEATAPVVSQFSKMTPKQQRYVRIMIATGMMVVPYVRTHAYAKNWQVRKVMEGKDRIGYALENPVPYAKWLAGSRGSGQAAVHRGRWKTLRTVLQTELADLPTEVSKELALKVARARRTVD
jgi:hypothetical protein